MNITAQQFVRKWAHSELKERSASQEHFLDLCRLIGHPTPAELDPRGDTFCFEAGASKSTGGEGFADVWKRGCFAWEYKGRHADLAKAYEQLLKYRESLENPPLLVVSDTDRIVIHTNFTNTIKQVITLTLDDLLLADQRQRLADVFFHPERFRSERTTESVTQEAAARFAEMARILARYDEDPSAVAHFLIRLLFCLFAEDTGLLPEGVFTTLVRNTRTRPKAFADQLQFLFRAMATGGMFGAADIKHFNGGLFDNAVALELDSDCMDILANVGTLDWANIEPSILGTLFERGLDPRKRSQLGAHYTSREDILLIVEPVLMAPLRRRWAAVQAQAGELAARRDAAKTNKARSDSDHELAALLHGYARELAEVRVLDPACGSGNFLYVALRQLLDLWNEVSTYAFRHGLAALYPLPGSSPHPDQLHGIEINPYAHELAQTTIWIGYLQWLRENGHGIPAEPILSPLQNIVQMDAILAYDAQGRPAEPAWPAADVIIGNPPFLGGKRLRTELGDAYVDTLFALYDERVPREADLVCYWFERARAYLEQDAVKRAGLLATQGIRGGASRRVLERIKASGDLFYAWADREWVLDGANVHVSMVGFDGGDEAERKLDGRAVPHINPDLTSAGDLTTAQRLPENADLSFMGDTKVGPFDITADVAKELLAAVGNPNGKPNSDVVRPWANGLDVTRRPRGMYIVDFGLVVTQEQAAQYEMPFAYVEKHVRPERLSRGKGWYREQWWLHYAPRPQLRAAVSGMVRYVATPRVAKHRLFVWMPRAVLPDCQLIVFARDDDYFLGVLHSRPHELWALRQGTQLEDRPRYTPTTTFETYPFPWPPGQEPTDDVRVQAVAAAAQELVTQRDRWLNPAGASEAELKRRTLTNLYNQRPTWLDLAHKRLDQAVFAAYGWPSDLSDEAVLERLLALNLERAGERG